MHRLKHIKLNSRGRKVLRQRLSGPGRTNFVGRASAVALALLALVILSPTVSEGADALTIADYTDTASTNVKVVANPAMSIGLDKSVNLEFTATTTGEFQSKTTKLTVSTNNTDGYKILMATNTGTLSNGSDNTIKSITGSNITPDDFAMNSRGYKIGDSIGYNAIPTVATEIKWLDTGEITVGSADTYDLAFGTRVGSSLPAGTYSGEVIISAIANPIKITNMMQLTYLQDMKPEYCTNTVGTDGEAVSASRHNEPSIQLQDLRDQKWYWVSKLADGNCWMTQDLHLDLPASPSTDFINYSDNIPASWKPAEATRTNNNFNVSNNGYSWNIGNYKIANPNSTESCIINNNQSTETSCQNKITKINYALNSSEALGKTELHYLIGNYYAWDAATAGTALATGDASGSVCPKGWELPKISSTNSYTQLMSTYNIANGTESVIKITSEPLYFVRTGAVTIADKQLFQLADAANYWIGSSSGGTYLFYFAGTSSVNTGYLNYPNYGRTLRCTARLK